MASLKRSNLEMEQSEVECPSRKRQRLNLAGFSSLDILDGIQAEMARAAELQKSEQQKNREKELELKKKIAELQEEVSKFKRNNRHLKYKLSTDVDIQVHDLLQEAEFTLAEMENDHKAQSEGLEWDYNEKLEQMEHENNWQRNYIDQVVSFATEKEQQFEDAKHAYFNQLHEAQEEKGDLIMELQVKDYEFEEMLQHQAVRRRSEGNYYKKNIERLKDQLQVRDHRLETEMRAKDDDIQRLEMEMQFKDHQHETELEELEKQYKDKMKRQYSYVGLSYLSKAQMLEIQDHLRKHLNLSTICSICADAHKNTALNPCGHQFCDKCCERFTIKCPICKTRIQSKINLMPS